MKRSNEQPVEPRASFHTTDLQRRASCQPRKGRCSTLNCCMFLSLNPASIEENMQQRAISVADGRVGGRPGGVGWGLQGGGRASVGRYVSLPTTMLYFPRCSGVTRKFYGIARLI
ncbi:hypothetical protein FKV68_14170 [Sinorhizobium mexicanum]|uniref:Uncharacterized protein n=1 Tax=Sinorhizobium mexicanum TaxID=375549 RepID=A0A859QJM6_9HYPH|nr:hypothetical protein FKV68_14170 [Sinorhizobium mexicanum]